MQEGPVLQQFLSMDFGPRFDQALLCTREVTADALDRVECEHALGFLMDRMKVGPMVRRADFHKHADNDSEEA